MTTLTYEVAPGEKKTIIMQEEIGAGGFGHVYKGVLDGFGTVAVKIQKMTRDNFNSLITEVKIREIIGSMPDYAVPVERVLINPSVLSKTVKENNFISLTDTVPANRAISIYPFAGDVDLFGIVHAHYKALTPLSKEMASHYTKQLIFNLKKLHDNNIVHRDIKPENIMLGSGNLRYIDFGFACFAPNCKGKKGTAQYAAPEVLKDDSVQISSYKKTDVFSLGDTLFFLLTLGRHILEIEVDDERTNYDDVYRQIIRDTSNSELREFIHKQIIDKLTGDFEIFIPLIKGMSEPEESSRFSIDQCVTWVNENL